VFLADDKLTQIVANTPTEIPVCHRFTTKNSPGQNRRDKVKKLLADDHRNNHPQVWRLQRKPKKKGGSTEVQGL
jgi:type IV secretory pathway ATPase VirB11/archaellum biosynthesis ATPase